MSYGASRPPLTPALLLGLALHAVPRAALDFLLADAMDQAARQYPLVFDRLAALGETRVVIDPVDLPIAFDLRLSGGRATLSVEPGRAAGPAPAATVRGSLADLVALLEGRSDGDALFFNRRLAVEGSTETVVTLRNAVEGEEMSVLDMLSRRVAPFDPVLRAAAGPAAHAYGMAERALAAIQQAVEGPAPRRAPDAPAGGGPRA